MKIISYNVNGIRAAISKGFEWLKQVNPDVVCLQEIKASEQPVIGFELAGYPYHYWFPATKGI
jgi:exodeoxyribonuclease-3